MKEEEEEEEEDDDDGINEKEEQQRQQQQEQLACCDVTTSSSISTNPNLDGPSKLREPHTNGPNAYMFRSQKNDEVWAYELDLSEAKEESDAEKKQQVG